MLSSVVLVIASVRFPPLRLVPQTIRTFPVLSVCVVMMLSMMPAATAAGAPAPTGGTVVKVNLRESGGNKRVVALLSMAKSQGRQSFYEEANRRGGNLLASLRRIP